jgi:predicted  nucleic acid-binding Zn-ribbon protein
MREDPDSISAVRRELVNLSKKKEQLEQELDRVKDEVNKLEGLIDTNAVFRRDMEEYDDN